MNTSPASYPDEAHAASPERFHLSRRGFVATAATARRFVDPTNGWAVDQDNISDSPGSTNRNDN